MQVKSVGLTTVKRSEFSAMDSLFLRGKTRKQLLRTGVMDRSSEERAVGGTATGDSRRGRWRGRQSLRSDPREARGGDRDEPPPHPVCASGRHPSNRARQPGAGTRINRCMT